MNQEIDNSIENYFCMNCNKIHKRYYRNKLNNAFFEHFEHANLDIDDSKIWKNKFNKNFNKYNSETHKKSIGSKKQ